MFDADTFTYRVADSPRARPPMALRISLSGEKPEAPLLRRFEGVGLVRGEFIFRASGDYMTRACGLQQLRAYLQRVCEAQPDGPVWYRLCDLWTDEARTLVGHPHRAEEANPMLGLRGIRAALADPDALRLELAQVASVAQAYPNLHLLVPFVRDAADLERLLPEVRAAGFPNRLGTMVEIPSAAFDVDRLIGCGMSNLFVGLNDLSCLVLGQDRGDAAAKAHPSLWRIVDEVRRAAAGRCEWGIGGALTPATLRLAWEHGAHYASVHYADLPTLLGLDATALPDLDWVREVKRRTRARKRAASRPAGSP